jgi:serine protease
VAAAGNGGNTAKSYPTSYPSIMSVAAVDKSSNKATFSQWNDAVDIAAPGVGTLSINSVDTTGDNKLNYSGTSMATPYVAGVAALLFGKFVNVSTDKKPVVNNIRETMETTALHRGATGKDNQYGHGIVKAKAAYDWMLTGLCQIGEGFKSAPTVSPPACMDVFGDVTTGPSP